MVKNLIFSGGGVKGLAFIGVYKYLEEIDGLRYIDKIIGVSIGSAFAFLVTLGYNYRDIYNVFINIDFSKTHSIINIDFSKTHSINTECLFNFVDNYGLDNGEKISKILKIFLRRKYKVDDITFNELFEKTNINLNILGTCLTTMSSTWFNLKNSPTMSVITAIKISMALPFIFMPLTIDNKIYVDGGLTNNYPIDSFNNNNKETIGIVITNDSFKYYKIDNIIDYMLAVLQTNFVKQDNEKIIKYFDVTIELKIDSNALEFNITREKKQEFIDLGYEQTKNEIRNKYSFLLKTNHYSIKNE